jgi:hypothetical protein
MKRSSMKKEYDFSKGIRGRFFNKNAKLNIPVYLDGETQVFIERIALKRKTDPSTVVNELLKREIKIADYLK